MKALQLWLDAMGHSQQWLADELNISRQAVNAWMMGKAEPSLDMLRRIRTITGIPYERLLEVEEKAA